MSLQISNCVWKNIAQDKLLWKKSTFSNFDSINESLFLKCHFYCGLKKWKYEWVLGYESDKQKWEDLMLKETPVFVSRHPNVPIGVRSSSLPIELHQNNSLNSFEKTTFLPLEKSQNNNEKKSKLCPIDCVCVCVCVFVWMSISLKMNYKDWVFVQLELCLFE
jgi:hypothetical protein